MTEQRKYKCQKCGLMVILYGGRTCDTMVVCNCGAWMDIHHEEDLTPLQNKEDKGKSGEIAVNRPLNDQMAFVIDSEDRSDNRIDLISKQEGKT